MDNTNSNQEDGFEMITNNRSVRQFATRGSHLMFFHIYFSHYIRYAIAEFQKDIFRITEDAVNKLALIVAFRGSGKSTLVTFSYALWAILGGQGKKFVLIICQTQAQAKQHMTNIKYELEQNKLLKSDMGPFREEGGSEQWAISSLVFQNTGARIMIASLEQSIRGLRHHEHRPDLIILDDIEDVNSTKTFENRNKTFDWFTREIVPLGDIGTRIIIVGNLLHEDSLVMRLKRKIDKKEMDGIYRWFPLLDSSGVCAWPGKFDSWQKIEEERKKIGNDLAWQQEYLLEIASDTSRVVHPEWIQTYMELPKDEISRTIVGIDLAISQRDTADYTAMVTLVVYGWGTTTRVYVLPNPINKRLSLPDVVHTVNALHLEYKNKKYLNPEFIVESNGFQEIYVNTLAERGYAVKGVKTKSDKRSRLALVGHYIKTGLIKFPASERHGQLVAQLTGFGMEPHDDLADAFSIAVLQVMERMEGDRGLESWLRWCEENGGPYIG